MAHGLLWQMNSSNILYLNSQCIPLDCDPLCLAQSCLLYTELLVTAHPFILDLQQYRAQNRKGVESCLHFDENIAEDNT